MGNADEAANHRFGHLFGQAFDPRQAFGALFEAVPLGLTLLDAAGVMLDVNDHVCRCLGYPRTDLVGRSVYDVTHPDDAAEQRLLTEKLRRNEIPRFQLDKRVIRRDRSETWVRVTVCPFDLPGGPPGRLISTSEDITARRLADERLRQSEERFRILVEGVREYALFLMDATGTITSWNPGAERVLGWEEEEIVGKHLRVIFTPEDQAAGVPEYEMETAARDGTASDDRWHIRKDGTPFYAVGAVHPLLGDRGEVRGYAKVLGDFTGRHKAEVWLQRQASLLDMSLDAIVVQEPVANRIVYWSRSAERTYGWSRQEAEGQVAYELLKTEFPVPRMSVLTALSAAGRWEGDLVHTCKDGRRIIAASRWALEEHPDHRGVRLVLEVNRDVTDQRRGEAEQRAYGINQKRIADALQKSLLMAPPPDLHPGLTIKPLYQAAQDDVLVGGDFFDIFAVAKDEVAVVIGDATGKGLEAATYTAEVKFVLRAYIREFASPALAMQRLNSFVCNKEQLDAAHIGQSYMAVAAVVINTRTGEVASATAGIEAPLLLRASGQDVDMADGGPLLGVTADAAYEDIRTVIGAGDVIALSTDGLTEARHPLRRRDFFGAEALARSVRRHDDGTTSLADVAAAVVRDARDFAGGLIRDDVCLLLVKRTELPAP